MPVAGWEAAYAGLIRDAADALAGVPGPRPDRGTHHPPVHAGLEGGPARLVSGLGPAPRRGRARGEADQVRHRQARLPQAADAGDARRISSACLARDLPAARVLYWT